jgi:HPt (histidine-containing phosphotransfer) domain-containing protein
MDRQACIDAGINYDEGVARFVGNAEMYERFLMEFLSDPTFALLDTAMGEKNISAAFQASHSLKGLSGNLSLERLYQKLVALTDALRGVGDLRRAESLFPAVKTEYQQICAFLTEQRNKRQ